tara:strand:- start:2848 stop:3696 length:849 start_codon:yes stop_codon:yes gene_type:complete
MSDNIKLVHIQGILTESFIPISEHLVGYIIDPYVVAHDQLIEILSNKDALAVDVISSAINFSKVRTFKSNIESNIIESSNILIDLYSGLIQLGVSVYKDESLSKYSLTEDKYVIEKNKFNTVFKDDISLFYNELNELEKLHREVSNQFQIIKPYMSDETDWGSIAKSFGTGALAGLFPLIGVPALISNLLGEHKKDQKIDYAFEQFDEKWQDYLGQWDNTYSVLHNVFSNTMERIKSKVERDIIQSALKYCSIIASKGHDLERYYSELREELITLDREFYEE